MLSSPLPQELLPNLQMKFSILSMLHHEIVPWNRLWSDNTVHNEERWKRKEKDGETDDQAEQKDGIKNKDDKTDPLLITAGLTSPNFGHLY